MFVERVGNSPTRRSAGADPAPVRVGSGTVGDQRDVALARRDHRGGVVGMELVGRPADRGIVDQSRLDAEILRDTEPANVLVAAVVVHGVNVAPAQPGVLPTRGPPTRP